jgi:ArsR family transcriptional regulator, virulence genes transcriptional regulator
MAGLWRPSITRKDTDLEQSLITQDDTQPKTALFRDMECAVQEAAELLRSIGSPYRLMILCLLTDQELTVTEICDMIGARQSLTSQHLSRLRLDGLVKAERRGHFVYYSLADTVVREIIGVLYKHFCGVRRNPAA